MKNLKRIAALSIVAGGLTLAGAGVANAEAHAGGQALGSPGVASGNQVQAPVHVPANVCGTTVNALVGALNPTTGNVCGNG